MLTAAESSMLTVMEVGQRLGLKPSTVRLWISKGKFAHLRLGRSVRIPESEVTRVIEESTIPLRSGVGTAAAGKRENDVEQNQ